MTWRSTLFRLCVAGSSAFICAANGIAEDDPVKWRWRCASSGYYGMDVPPNGPPKPFVAPNDRSITITVREATRSEQDACGHQYDGRYYVELDREHESLWEDGFTCEQFSHPSFHTYRFDIHKDPELESFEAVELRYMRNLIIKREDVEWRFVLSGTDLTTARDSRRLRVEGLSSQMNIDPKAATWFDTGECVMF